MASDDEVCVNDPNFAIICSFFNKFGKICGVECPSISGLQAMLENDKEVHPALVDLHVKLLRKARKTVHSDKWERALVKFIHTYSNQDAWNLEHLGYKKLKLSQRLFILKNLLEVQFDANTKFKAVITQFTAADLRLEPIGRDKKGNAYWFQVDDDCNLRVYKEDLDEELWTLVAQNREELLQLISELNGPNLSGNNTISNDDSNSVATISSLLTTKINEDKTLKVENTILHEDQESEEFLSPDDEENYYDDDDNAKDGMQSDQIGESVTLINPVFSEKVNMVNNEQLNLNKRKQEYDDIHNVEKKVKISCENSESLNSSPKDFSEVIEEPVLIVTGQGSGKDCNVGNPLIAENSNKILDDDNTCNQHLLQNCANNSMQQVSETVFSDICLFSDVIEEPVMAIIDRGSGVDCNAVNPITVENSEKLLDNENGHNKHEFQSSESNLTYQLSQTVSTEFSIFSDVIEEPVMTIFGVGSGVDCDAGNPEDTENADAPEGKNTDKGIIIEEHKSSSSNFKSSGDSGNNILHGNKSLVQTLRSEISDAKSSQNQPIMFFGQPGCLKLNPVMIRTSGHSSFLNTSKDINEKVHAESDIEFCGSENILFKNTLNLGTMSSGVCPSSNRLINSSNENTTVVSNEKEHTTESTSVNKMSDDSVSHIDSSLDESTSSALFYEVTDLNVITPNSSLIDNSNSQKNDQYDSKIASNKQNIEINELMSIPVTPLNKSSEHKNKNMVKEFDSVVSVDESDCKNVDSKSVLSNKSMDIDCVIEECEGTSMRPVDNFSEVIPNILACDKSKIELNSLDEITLEENNKSEPNTELSSMRILENRSNLSKINSEDSGDSSILRKLEIDNTKSNIMTANYTENKVAIDNLNETKIDVLRMSDSNILENYNANADISSDKEEKILDPENLRTKSSDQRFNSEISNLEEEKKSDIGNIDCINVNFTENLECIDIIEKENLEQHPDKQKNILNKETAIKRDLALNIEPSNSEKLLLNKQKTKILEFGTEQKISLENNKEKLFIDRIECTTSNISEKTSSVQKSDLKESVNIDISDKFDFDGALNLKINYEGEKLNIFTSEHDNNDFNLVKTSPYDIEVTPSVQLEKNNESENSVSKVLPKLTNTIQNSSDFTSNKSVVRVSDDVKSFQKYKNFNENAVEDNSCTKLLSLDNLEKPSCYKTNNLLESDLDNQSELPKSEVDLKANLNELKDNDKESSPVEIETKSGLNINNQTSKIKEEFHKITENINIDETKLHTEKFNDILDDKFGKMENKINENQIILENVLSDSSYYPENKNDSIILNDDIQIETLPDNDTLYLKKSHVKVKSDKEVENSVMTDLKPTGEGGEKILIDLGVNEKSEENALKENQTLEVNLKKSNDCDSKQLISECGIYKSSTNQNADNETVSDNTEIKISKNIEKTQNFNKSLDNIDEVSEPHIALDTESSSKQIISKINLDQYEESATANNSELELPSNDGDLKNNCLMLLKNIDRKDDIFGKDLSQHVALESFSKDTSKLNFESNLTDSDKLMEQETDNSEIIAPKEMNIQLDLPEMTEVYIDKSSSVGNNLEYQIELTVSDKTNKAVTEKKNNMSETLKIDTNIVEHVEESLELDLESNVEVLSGDRVELSSAIDLECYKETEAISINEEQCLTSVKFSSKSVIQNADVSSLNQTCSTNTKKEENISDIDTKIIDKEKLTEDLSESICHNMDLYGDTSSLDDSQNKEECPKVNDDVLIDNKSIIDVNLKKTICDSEDILIEKNILVNGELKLNSSTSSELENLVPSTSDECVSQYIDKEVINNQIISDAKLEDKIKEKDIITVKEPCEIDLVKNKNVDVEKIENFNTSIDDQVASGYISLENKPKLEESEYQSLNDEAEPKEEVFKEMQEEKVLFTTGADLGESCHENHEEKRDLLVKHEKILEVEAVVQTEEKTSIGNKKEKEYDKCKCLLQENIGSEKEESGKYLKQDEFIESDAKSSGDNLISYDVSNVKDIKNTLINKDLDLKLCDQVLLNTITKIDNKVADQTMDNLDLNTITLDDNIKGVKEIREILSSEKNDKEDVDITTVTEIKSLDNNELISNSNSNSDISDEAKIPNINITDIELNFCDEKSNIKKNIFTESFDIEKSPLKCTIVESAISEIIDFSGKVDDITTPLVAKNTDPDSETEFPDAGLSNDDDEILRDPLADPLAEDIDVQQSVDNLGNLQLTQIESAGISGGRGTRKRRISDKVEDSFESAENISSDEECGGKRIKMRGKKNITKKKHEEKSVQKKKEDNTEDEVLSDSNDTANKSDRKTLVEHKIKSHQEADKKAELQKPRKKTRRIMGLVVEEDAIITKNDETNVRQSRRIAQLKIKEEAERRKVEEITLTQLKEQSQKKRSSKNDDKEYKVEKRKRNLKDDSSTESEDDSHNFEVRRDKKKKKRGRKRKPTSKPAFDETKPWQSSSSDSSSDKDGEDDDIEFDQEHSEDEHTPVLKSDHEFSPESDLDGEYQPTRRARTAKKDSGETEAEVYDDQHCQQCGKSDQPEWILLCDECDCGYHCSCLKPVLFIIPEGDWFCPPCQQKRLIINLQSQLVEYDKLVKNKEDEDLRKERLGYSTMSEENNLENEEKLKYQQENEESVSSSSGSSDSESTDSEDESGYKLRERRAVNVCYRFNDYDDLINKAIKDEMDVVKESAGNMGRGKDISTIIEAENEEKFKTEGLEREISKEDDKQSGDEEQNAKSSSDIEGKDESKKQSDDSSSSDSDAERLNRLQALSRRKKQRKLNALDVSSEEDHVSDEDFKGSSVDSEDEDLESNSDYSDSEIDIPKKKGATRRSTRARTTRYDRAFINDSDDSSDAPKRKKKYRSILSDEDEESLTSSSEDSDIGWKSKKKRSIKQFKATTRKMPKFPPINKREASDATPKKPKKKRVSELSDLAFRGGGLRKSEQEELTEGRRTRGKKINYVEALASDSDEDKKKKKRSSIKRIVSEDEYVPVDDEKINQYSTIVNPVAIDQNKINTEITNADTRPIDDSKNDFLANVPTNTQSKIAKVNNSNLVNNRISAAKVARVDSSFEGSEDCIDEEDEETPDEDDEDLDDDNIDEEDEHFDLDRSKSEESEDLIAKRMMEDPDFAAMRLQQVAAQIARDKKRKAAEEKKQLKEERKLERIRKRDEKAKIKEEKAKEREEKKIAKQAALAAAPVERKKPGRKPKSMTTVQNQQISNNPDLGCSRQMNVPLSSNILANRLNTAIPSPNQSLTGYNTKTVQNQLEISDNSKVLSSMISNPSSPCTSSNMSNTSTPNMVSGTSPVPVQQNFGSNIHPQMVNVVFPGQRPVMSQSPSARSALQSNTAVNMPGLQNLSVTPKRRGRGRGKKALGIESAMNQLGRGAIKKDDEKTPSDISSNLSVAAPPQPFSASQPSPSVITRMLHNPGGNSVTIMNNPQLGRNSNTAVPVTNISTGVAQGSTASPSTFQGKYYPHHESYLQRPRGQMAPTLGMYRPQGPMGGYPPRGMYHSPHHPLDPSPSGGGPINVQPPNVTPGQLSGSPSLRPGTPPKIRPPYEYMHQPSGNRHPQFHHNQPYGYQGQHPPQGYIQQPPYQYEPGSQQPTTIHQPMHTALQSINPSSAHSLPQPILSMSAPPQPGSIIDDQQYNNVDSAESISNPVFEREGEHDEASGEFGGLVSYFSSQHEDDLET